MEEALKAVSEGKVDAFVDNLASIGYSTQKLGLSNLKVAMTTPYSFDLAFGVRKDWPTLINIINKGLESIPDSKKAETNNRWVNVRFERRVEWAPVLKVIKREADEFYRSVTPPWVSTDAANVMRQAIAGML